MDNLKYNKKIIIFCLVLILLTILVYLFINNKERFIGKPVLYQEIIIDKYEANQYIPVYVTESDMANKYLNDYKNLLINDINEAYNKLNKEYKEKKFTDFNIFTEYIENKKSLNFYSMTVKEYKVINYNGYKFYYINSSIDDLYIFKELSIMNYEVYFDDFTIEVK